MSATNPPKYIYKILPSSPTPPSPLPLSMPLSDLDRRDNFLHFSTSAQLLGTLNAFFAKEEFVWILRVPYARVEKWIKWETADAKCWDPEGKEGGFPHIYANGEDGGLKLGRDEVDDVGKWVRGAGEWSAEGWCFEEDMPGK